MSAIWLIARRAHDRLLVEVGQVWLALSLCELWSKLAFKLFYPLIAPAEVAFMAWVGRSAIPGLYASGLYLSGRPGWSIVMLEGCSAFHNLSLAALIWLCVLRIAGRRATRGAAAALAASAALVSEGERRLTALFDRLTTHLVPSSDLRDVDPLLVHLPEG